MDDKNRFSSSGINCSFDKGKICPLAKRNEVGCRQTRTKVINQTKEHIVIAKWNNQRGLITTDHLE